MRGTNLLLLYPRWAVLAAAAPMPVFFAAGGWANASTSPRGAAPRLRTLIGLAAAVVGCWSIAVLVASAFLGGEPGVLGKGARLATQPLWFLAAYVPFAFWGRALARGATARPFASIGGCLVALGASMRSTSGSTARLAGVARLLSRVGRAVAGRWLVAHRVGTGRVPRATIRPRVAAAPGSRPGCSSGAWAIRRR